MEDNVLNKLQKTIVIADFLEFLEQGKDIVEIQIVGRVGGDIKGAYTPRDQNKVVSILAEKLAHLTIDISDEIKARDVEDYDHD